jgi:hypothetical protein
MANDSVYWKAWNDGKDYASYREMLDALLVEGKTTGQDQSEAMIAYAELNQHRMKRLEKTYTVSAAALDALNKVSQPIGALVITEGWCGDAAQSLPVIAAMCKVADIPVRCVLRDESPALIDLHLTNGARSIPKVLFIDLDQWIVMASWGPRPQALQRMVTDYRALSEPKLPYTEFAKNIQLWYAKDKQQSIEQEMIEMLKACGTAIAVGV